METKAQKSSLTSSKLSELRSVVDRYVKRHLSKEDAEDVGQNVFLSLLKWWDTGERDLKGDDLKFFTLKIAKNAVLKKRISNEKAPSVSLDDVEANGQYEHYRAISVMKALTTVEDIRALSLTQRCTILFRNADLVRLLQDVLNYSEEKLAKELGFDGFSAQVVVAAIKEIPMNDEQIWEMLKQIEKTGKKSVVRIERRRARQNLRKS